MTTTFPQVKALAQPCANVPNMNTRTARAIEAHQLAAAARNAADPVKLGRAVRIVRAALLAGRFTLDERIALAELAAAADVAPVDLVRIRRGVVDPR